CNSRIRSDVECFDIGPAPSGGAHHYRDSAVCPQRPLRHDREPVLVYAPGIGEKMMPKPRVLATRPLFPAAHQILNTHCDVEYWTQPERISREELLSRGNDKEALVCLLTEKVDEDLLRAGPKLRVVANVAVGFDNIDVGACTKRGVLATNTPGVLDETTADFAWTLLMAVARRLGEGEQLARSGAWKGWDLDQLVGTDVWGKK